MIKNHKFETYLVSLSIWAFIVGAEVGSNSFALLKSLVARFGKLTLAAILIIGILRHPAITVAAMPSMPGERGTLTMEADKEVISAVLEAEVESTAKEPEIVPVKTFKAVRTEYSRADSCHNMKNGICYMASGRGVYEGAVACPRSLRLGTVVRVEGVMYTCEDRYSTRLDKLRGLPTIDVFVNKNPKGRRVVVVEVMPEGVILASK
jgi:hypothetical protein